MRIRSRSLLAGLPIRLSLAHFAHPGAEPLPRIRHSNQPDSFHVLAKNCGAPRRVLTWYREFANQRVLEEYVLGQFLSSEVIVHRSKRWGSQCSLFQRSPLVFGTPRLHDVPTAFLQYNFLGIKAPRSELVLNRGRQQRAKLRATGTYADRNCRFGRRKWLTSIFI